MIACMSPARISDSIKEEGAMLHVLDTLKVMSGYMGGYFFQICGILVSVLLIVIGINLIKKQEAKGY